MEETTEKDDEMVETAGKNLRLMGFINYTFAEAYYYSLFTGRLRAHNGSSANLREDCVHRRIYLFVFSCEDYVQRMVLVLIYRKTACKLMFMINL